MAARQSKGGGDVATGDPRRQEDARSQEAARRPKGNAPEDHAPEDSAQAVAGAAAGEVSERVIEAAERAAAEVSTDDAPLGPPGPPLNRRSPFFVGLLGAAGVATTYAVAQALIAARGVLVLIGLALFLAIGLDPAVRWLGRWMPRWLAVTAVTLTVVAVVVGFLSAAIPPLVGQGTALIHNLPHYLSRLQDRSSTIGRLNTRYHLQQRLSAAASSGGQNVFGGVLGAGQMVLNATAATGTVLALTVYFLADMSRIRALIYRLVPHRRRPRAILLGDAIFEKVGGFVLGNLATSAIAGVGTFAWLVIFRVPYPLLLAFMVAILDLIPVIGSTVAGIIVSLIALSVSLPVAIATLIFYVAFRLAEDYLIVPKIVGRVVEVPATATLVAVLLGGAMLGVVGALIAIPAAAAARILLQEIVFPRLDRT
jgi:predicted PurR-regulated permease PerM